MSTHIRKWALRGLLAAWAATGSIAAEGPVVLRADVRAIPGSEPTPWLLYDDAALTNTQVAGSWNAWTNRHRMTRQGRTWALDVGTLPAGFGRHEFKFITNGVWEHGPNRVLYLNEEGLLERPSDLVFSARLEKPDEVEIALRRPLPAPPTRVRFVPPLPVRGWRSGSAEEDGARRGYFIRGGSVTFVFDERAYGLDLPPSAQVTVAGNFSGWDAGGRGGRWGLRDDDDNGLWELTTPLDGIRPPPGERDRIFKFVVNGNRWLPPPPGSPNARPDGKGNVNLLLDPNMAGGSSLHVELAAPPELSSNYTVVLEGAGPRPLWSPVDPGGAVDRLVSDKPLGVTLDRAQGSTTYRLFAPRASSVDLALYADHRAYRDNERLQPATPAERYPMWRDPADGVWEITLLGLDIGRYYAFFVDGPQGNGEGFNPKAPVGDPYARAAAHAENLALVIDPDATNRWFGGWTDQAFRTPEADRVMIYETHVRDLTAHPSSGVPGPLRGTYEGLLATRGSGAGLDHIRTLGVNAIEFLPIAEFNNGPTNYNWGYSTVFYFAPEASYGQRPLEGSQYYEFKNLVNELHRESYAVILDVVYNHVGWPNLFEAIDKKYYFRLLPDYTHSNFSGCGNDVRTEAPMMRRLIVDNIVYWMKEFHIDGFRFDLAELIDMETMMAIRDAARAINPNVILISEPWSFRGENKHLLKGTGWSAWNNDFRYAAKGFVMNERNRDWLKKKIVGSTGTWSANPLQAVNYVESHDDMALADELSTRPDRDGHYLQPRDVDANRLAATILFTSLGIPMIQGGQEFIRSKYGIHNTYNRGDPVNAIDWTHRDRPPAAEALAYYRGLMRLRQSPEGAAFRVSQRAPEGYYRWIEPADAQALGYIVNAPRIHAGASFAVLLNGAPHPVRFNFVLPPGSWRMIGDGRAIDPNGLPGREPLQGGKPVSITVPPVHAYLLMQPEP